MLFSKQRTLIAFFLTSVGIATLSNIFIFSLALESSSKTLIEQKIRTPIKNNGNDFNKINLLSQNINDKQLIRDEKNLEKEIRKDEKNLEKEAKKSCSIAFSPKEGKRNKCEPSVENDLYPGMNTEINFDELSKITEQFQKDINKSAENVIVK